jgi:hypothetical protein
MRPALVRLTPLLILLLAGACSRHPTYGRPVPRDTLPATKAPESLESPPNRPWSPDSV